MSDSCVVVNVLFIGNRVVIKTGRIIRVGCGGVKKGFCSRYKRIEYADKYSAKSFNRDMFAQQRFGRRDTQVEKCFHLSRHLAHALIIHLLFEFEVAGHPDCIQPQFVG
mgnify:CR=1 FL=1